MQSSLLIKRILVFLVIIIIVVSSIKYMSTEDKNKVINRNPDHLISPSYGKITGIRDQGDGYIRISIFLNLWDVHEQYMPVSGIIQNVNYKPGEFNGAYFLEKSDKNERMDTLITGPYGLVGVSQIAGYIFKTIVLDVKRGQQVEQGDKLGRIKFGSRVDLVIPNIGTKILAKVGDKVVGGTTVLASWN